MCDLFATWAARGEITDWAVDLDVGDGFWIKTTNGAETSKTLDVWWDELTQRADWPPHLWSALSAREQHQSRERPAARPVGPAFPPARSSFGFRDGYQGGEHHSRRAQTGRVIQSRADWGDCTSR